MAATHCSEPKYSVFQSALSVLLITSNNETNNLANNKHEKSSNQVMMCDSVRTNNLVYLFNVNNKNTRKRCEICFICFADNV